MTEHDHSTYVEGCFRCELGRDEVDELHSFLDAFHYIYPNLNDTFGYAAADSERVYLDGESNQDMLVAVWRKFGHAGITAYCAKIRGTEPIAPLVTPEYEAAMKMLDGWEYDDD